MGIGCMLLFLCYFYFCIKVVSEFEVVGVYGEVEVIDGMLDLIGGIRNISLESFVYYMLGFVRDYFLVNDKFFC